MVFSLYGQRLFYPADAEPAGKPVYLFQYQHHTTHLHPSTHSDPTCNEVTACELGSTTYGATAPLIVLLQSQASQHSSTTRKKKKRRRRQCLKGGCDSWPRMPLNTHMETHTQINTVAGSSSLVLVLTQLYVWAGDKLLS